MSLYKGLDIYHMFSFNFLQNSTIKPILYIKNQNSYFDFVCTLSKNIETVISEISKIHVNLKLIIFNIFIKLIFFIIFSL